MATKDSKTKKPPRREYSDAEISTALTTLDLNKGNVFKTAGALSIPETTLRKWKKAREEKPEGVIATTTAEFQGSLKDRFEQEIHRAFDAAGTKLNWATLSELIRYIEIMTDKYQVLNNKPSSITGQHSENKLHILADLLLQGSKPDEPKLINPAE